jgi:hypothetical protein
MKIPPPNRWTGKTREIRPREGEGVRWAWGREVGLRRVDWVLISSNLTISITYSYSTGKPGTKLTFKINYSK